VIASKTIANLTLIVSKEAAVSSRRGTWTLGEDEAQTLLTNARRAFFVMVGVLALLWIIQIINFAGGYQLNQTFGISARDVAGLPYILTAPFLHVSWAHIEGNSGPLFIFGFLAAYRGLAKFAAVTVAVILISGLAAWFFEAAGTVGVGASGVVFGYFGYIMVRGLFDRRVIDVIIGAVMALCFAYQFSVLLPHQGIGWQAHVGGVVGGVLSGWLFRDSRAVRAARSAKSVRSAQSVRSEPAPSAAAGSPSGTVALPASKPAGKPAKKGPAIDPSNPRADLYKQLDDLGL
jgi:membrane associated rhomboid family serine protease